MATFLLYTLCYYLKGSKPMNFTGSLIYLISAKIPGGFIQQSRTFCIISKTLNRKRQFQQLFVRLSSSSAVREGRAGNGMSPEHEHPLSRWLLPLSYHTPV